jgi:uncharacterized protein (TIGR03435 family)
MLSNASRLTTVVVFMYAGSAAASAQPPGRLQFEVASVKRSAFNEAEMQSLAKSGNPVRRGRQISGTRAEYIYMSLGQLIMEAYQLRSSQISGPTSLFDDRFDVVCRMPEGSKPSESATMLQALLTERFKLVAHLGAREESVLALVVGKSGPKLKPSGVGNESLPEGRVRHSTASDGAVAVTNGSVAVSWTNSASGGHRLTGSMPISYLATMLNSMGVGKGRQVVDKTELKGYYQIVIDVPAGVAPGSNVPVASLASGSREPDQAGLPSDPTGETLQRSLRSLGLELEARKVPIQHLFIDSVQRVPTEN